MKKQLIWVFGRRKSVHYWWSYILFVPECKELIVIWCIIYAFFCDDISCHIFNYNIHHWKTWITGSVVTGDFMTQLPNPLDLLKSKIQHPQNTHKQIKFVRILFFKPIKSNLQHFSRKIANFQGRLKNQTLFKTAIKFKHFSRSVGTMHYYTGGVSHLLLSGVCTGPCKGGYCRLRVGVNSIPEFNWNCSSIPIPIPELELELKLVELKMELELKTLELELNFLQLLSQQLLVNQSFPNFSFNRGAHNLSCDWLFMQQVFLGNCPPLGCGHKRHKGRVPCSSSRQKS